MRKKPNSVGKHNLICVLKYVVTLTHLFNTNNYILSDNLVNMYEK